MAVAIAGASDLRRGVNHEPIGDIIPHQITGKKRLFDGDVMVRSNKQRKEKVIPYAQSRLDLNFQDPLSNSSEVNQIHSNQ